MDDLISRDAAIAEIDCGGCYGKCVDPANCRLDDVAAIRAIQPPTHAALLAAALKLPEVAALVTLAHSIRGRLDADFAEDREMAGEIDPILAALEARHE